MKKKLLLLSTVGLLLLTQTGCSPIGQKSASLTIIYAAAAVLSLMLLIGYCCLVPKRDPWFLLLFASIFVVNLGYFTLAISRTLEEALLANRISYLGSVFLPMSMLMIILGATKSKYPKWLAAALMGLGIVIFLIAASPGYLDIYYKQATLVIVNGTSTLEKVYGPLHSIYLVYLLGYFGSMIAVIIHAIRKKRLTSVAHAVILLIAVFVNICVWLIGQLVDIEFEFLSISYLITELFLLGLHIFLMEAERLQQTLNSQTPPSPSPSPVPRKTAEEQHQRFLIGLSELTQTERAVYDAYISGMSTKEIMSLLNIKENTLKFHNKNLYSKLGVNSRKQLLEIYSYIKNQNA